MKALLSMSLLAFLAACGEEKMKDPVQAGSQEQRKDDSKDLDVEKEKKKKDSKKDDEDELPDVDPSRPGGDDDEDKDDEDDDGDMPGDPPPAETPAPELRGIFRSFKGDHLFSTSASEGPNAGYRDEGEAFKLLVNQIEGSIAMRRCLIGTVHFLSITDNCEGQRVEGIIGYLLPAQKPGTRELVRCTNATNTDVLSTSRAECANAGYNVVGPLGWAPEAGFKP